MSVDSTTTTTTNQELINEQQPQQPSTPPSSSLPLPPPPLQPKEDGHLTSEKQPEPPKEVPQPDPLTSENAKVGEEEDLEEMTEIEGETLNSGVLPLLPPTIPSATTAAAVVPPSATIQLPQLQPTLIQQPQLLQQPTTPSTTAVATTQLPPLTVAPPVAIAPAVIGSQVPSTIPIQQQQTSTPTTTAATISAPVVPVVKSEVFGQDNSGVKGPVPVAPQVISVKMEEHPTQPITPSLSSLISGNINTVTTTTTPVTATTTLPSLEPSSTTTATAATTSTINATTIPQQPSLVTIRTELQPSLFPTQLAQAQTSQIVSIPAPPPQQPQTTTTTAIAPNMVDIKPQLTQPSIINHYTTLSSQPQQTAQQQQLGGENCYNQIALQTQQHTMYHSGSANASTSAVNFNQQRDFSDNGDSGNSNNNNAAAAVNGQDPEKLQNALDFITQVRNHFANNIENYNSFLEIMKDFKSETVSTSGVIDRVKKLFAGAPHLISGFKTFLPPEYNDIKFTQPQQPEIIQPALRQSTLSNPTALTAQPPSTTTTTTTTMLPPTSLAPLPQGTTTSVPPPPPPAAATTTATTIIPTATATTLQPQRPQVYFKPQNISGTALQPPLYQDPLLQQSIQGHPQSQILQQPAMPPPDQSTRKTPEIDQARNYIKKIKERFKGQQQTYKRFLEILHAYRKEHHTITEVYKQVVTLFSNDTDLLDEFKLFLPEPVSDTSAISPMAAAGIQTQLVTDASKPDFSQTMLTAGHPHHQIQPQAVSLTQPQLPLQLQQMPPNPQQPQQQQQQPQQTQQQQQQTGSQLVIPTATGNVPGAAAGIGANAAHTQRKGQGHSKRQEQNIGEDGVPTGKSKRKTKDKNGGANGGGSGTSKRKRGANSGNADSEMMTMSLNAMWHEIFDRIKRDDGENAYNQLIKVLGLRCQDILTSELFLASLKQILSSENYRRVSDLYHLCRESSHGAAAVGSLHQPDQSSLLQPPQQSSTSSAQQQQQQDFQQILLSTANSSIPQAGASSQSISSHQPNVSLLADASLPQLGGAGGMLHDAPGTGGIAGDGVKPPTLHVQQPQFNRTLYRHPYGRISLRSCDRVGSSYRRLPPTIPQPKCEGRGDIENSVLNDYVICCRAADLTYIPRNENDKEESGTVAAMLATTDNDSVPFVPLRRTRYDPSYITAEDECHFVDVRISQIREAIRDVFVLMKKKPAKKFSKRQQKGCDVTGDVIMTSPASSPSPPPLTTSSAVTADTTPALSLGSTSTANDIDSTTTLTVGTQLTAEAINGNSKIVIPEIGDPSRVNDDSYLADPEAPVSAITRHVIGSMYLSRGSDVLRVLYEQPAVVGPVVLARLKQKLTEFLRYRREAAKKWHVSNEKHFKNLQDMHTGNHYLYQRGLARREILPSALLACARRPDGHTWNVPDSEPHATIRDILGNIWNKHRNSGNGCYSNGSKFRTSVTLLNTLFDDFVIPFLSTNPQQRGKTFYGNASFALFFGAYSKLYECISRGLHIGLSTDRVLWRSVMHSESTFGWMNRFDKLQTAKKCNTSNNNDNSNNNDSKTTSYFNVFIDAVMACVAGLFDRQTYEEMCVSLFPPDTAQTLFQAPTLAETVAEYTEALLESHSCDRLLAIFTSEKIPQDEKVNVARKEIGPDEECFEITFESDPENECNNRVTVKVLAMTDDDDDDDSSNSLRCEKKNKYPSFDDLPIGLGEGEKFVIGPVIRKPMNIFINERANGTDFLGSGLKRRRDGGGDDDACVKGKGDGDDNGEESAAKKVKFVNNDEGDSEDKKEAEKDKDVILSNEQEESENEK